MLLDIIRVYPISRKRGEDDPTCGAIASKLRQTCEEVPTIKSRFAHCTTDNPRIGTIVVPGKIEDLDFRNTAAPRLARQVDGLAMWMLENTILHVAPSLIVTLSEADQAEINERDGYVHFHKIFGKCADYHELPEIIKLLIRGVEQQLVRRVLAIGCTVQSAVEKDERTPYWMEVPKDRIRRVEVHEQPIA